MIFEGTKNQFFFGLELTRAGETLPTVDNLYALGALLEVSLEQILIPVARNPDIVCEQQAETCCSHCFLTGCSGCGKRPMQLPPFAPGARPAA